MASLSVVEDIKNALNQAAGLVPDDYQSTYPRIETHLTDLMSYVLLSAQMYYLLTRSTGNWAGPLRPCWARRAMMRVRLNPHELGLVVLQKNTP
jgi:hypothetical protein